MAFVHETSNKPIYRMQLRQRTSSLCLNTNYCEPIRDIQQHSVFATRMYILDLILIPMPAYLGLSPLITFKIHLNQWLANRLLPSLSSYASIKYQQSLKKNIDSAVVRKVVFKKKMTERNLYGLILFLCI